MKFHIADMVAWKSVAGVRVGYIESFEPEGILVRLEGGRCIIANEKSLYFYNEQK